MPKPYTPNTHTDPFHTLSLHVCLFKPQNITQAFSPLYFYKFLDKNESLAGIPLHVSVAVDGVWVNVDFLLFHIPLAHLQICVNLCECE